MRETMLIIHFIGLAMGLGTSFAFMFLGIASSKMEKSEGIKFNLNSFSLSRMGHIGLTLLILSGIYLMTPYWQLLPQSPLLIAKLALVIVLVVVIAWISMLTKKAKSGNEEKELKKIEGIGKISMVTALAIVVIAVLYFR